MEARPGRGLGRRIAAGGLVLTLVMASCADDSSAPVDADPGARVLAAIPDADVRTAARVALDAAVRSVEACADAVAWISAIDDAAQKVNVLTETATRRGDDWLDTGPALDLAAALRDRLVLQHGCPAGFSPGTHSSAALAAAGRASAANDDLYLTLAATEPRTGSEFWYHADQIGHTIEMQRLVAEEGPVEVIVIGSSTSKRGFDPSVLTVELGRSAMNAAVAGLFPATIDPWVETAMELSGAPGTIVLGVSSFQDFLGCDETRPTEARQIADLQERAFAPLPAVSSVPGAARLVGGAAATYDGTARREYQASPGGRGLVPSGNAPDPARVAEHLDFYGPQLAGGVYCNQNAAAISETARVLVARGHAVLVVSLPLSPLMADLHPDGRAGHDRAVDAYRRAAEGASAQWLDLTDLLDEGLFLDLTHATASGRDRITRATVAALA